MQRQEVIKILKRDLNFSNESIIKLQKFSDLLLRENKKYNLIAKSTEKTIWTRHILDSAQLVKFIDFNAKSLADLGSGAGLPGIVIDIFNKNKGFHVKLYEKSPVKRAFLEKVKAELNLTSQVLGNVNDENLDAEIIICRAFKKLDKVIQVSREIAKKPHKLIVLKGQNAQEDLNKTFKTKKYSYRLEESMTEKDSKIILMQIN